MDPSSKDYFDLPVFDAQPVAPQPIGYENAIRQFEELISAYKLREIPRKTEDIPEFKM